MTDRERWIVYPLLFLAIGLSLKSRFELKESQQQIVTNSLFLTTHPTESTGVELNTNVIQSMDDRITRSSELYNHLINVLNQKLPKAQAPAKQP